jgi:hypothetical protein
MLSCGNRISTLSERRSGMRRREFVTLLSGGPGWVRSSVIWLSVVRSARPDGGLGRQWAQVQP